MAYNTPRYDYARQSADLAFNKQNADAAQEFGRFLGQQRYRRNLQDAGQVFRRNFPKVGQSFNRRGLWNSGLRQEGQNQFAGDYAQQVGRMGEDQATVDSGFEMERTQRDAAYQRALQQLFEEMSAARTLTDPFAGFQIGGL